jgi:hypothetical protein
MLCTLYRLTYHPLLLELLEWEFCDKVKTLHALKKNNNGVLFKTGITKIMTKLNKTRLG